MITKQAEAASALSARGGMDRLGDAEQVTEGVVDRASRLPAQAGQFRVIAAEDLNLSLGGAGIDLTEFEVEVEASRHRSDHVADRRCFAGTDVIDLIGLTGLGELDVGGSDIGHMEDIPAATQVGKVQPGAVDGGIPVEESAGYAAKVGAIVLVGAGTLERARYDDIKMPVSIITSGQKFGGVLQRAKEAERGWWGDLGDRGLGRARTAVNVGGAGQDEVGVGCETAGCVQNAGPSADDCLERGERVGVGVGRPGGAGEMDDDVGSDSGDDAGDVDGITDLADESGPGAELALNCEFSCAIADAGHDVVAALAKQLNDVASDEALGAGYEVRVHRRFSSRGAAGMCGGDSQHDTPSPRAVGISIGRCFTDISGRRARLPIARLRADRAVAILCGLFGAPAGRARSREMAVDDILLDVEDRMEKAVDHLRHELRAIRTGRASTGLVDGMKVEVESYGATMTLKELANIAVAEGNVIVIKPFDPSTIKDIQKAIEKSEIGINPQNDGKMIRLPVPPLSTERRNQLASRIKDLGEQQKVSARNARRDANKELEAGKKDKTLTEDEVESGETQVQKLTDDCCKRIDELVAEKSKEVMEV